MKNTPRQLLALEMLSNGCDIPAVAEACNITRQAVYKYLSDPQFKAELNKRQSEHIQALAAQLLSLRGDFIAAIKAGLNDRNIATRLRAAGVYRSSYPEIFAINALDQRLVELEKHMKTKGTK